MIVLGCLDELVDLVIHPGLHDAHDVPYVLAICLAGQVPYREQITDPVLDIAIGQTHQQLILLMPEHGELEVVKIHDILVRIDLVVDARLAHDALPVDDELLEEIRKLDTVIVELILHQIPVCIVVDFLEDIVRLGITDSNRLRHDSLLDSIADRMKHSSILVHLSYMCLYIDETHSRGVPHPKRDVVLYSNW